MRKQFKAKRKNRGPKNISPRGKWSTTGRRDPKTRDIRFTRFEWNARFTRTCGLQSVSSIGKGFRDPLDVATRLRRRGGGIFSSSENRGGKNEGRVMRSRCILRPALVLHIKPSWMQFQTCFSLSLSFLSPLRLIRVHGTGHEGSEDLSLSLFFFYFHARISWWIMILTELFEVSGRKISCHRVRDRIEMKNLYEVILFFFLFFFFFWLGKLECSWSPWNKEVLFHLLN